MLLNLDPKATSGSPPVRGKLVSLARADTPNPVSFFLNLGLTVSYLIKQFGFPTGLGELISGNQHHLFKGAHPETQEIQFT